MVSQNYTQINSYEDVEGVEDVEDVEDVEYIKDARDANCVKCAKGINSANDTQDSKKEVRGATGQKNLSLAQQAIIRSVPNQQTSFHTQQDTPPQITLEKYRFMNFLTNVEVMNEQFQKVSNVDILLLPFSFEKKHINIKTIALLKQIFPAKAFKKLMNFLNNNSLQKHLPYKVKMSKAIKNTDLKYKQIYLIDLLQYRPSQKYSELQQDNFHICKFYMKVIVRQLFELAGVNSNKKVVIANLEWLKWPKLFLELLSNILQSISYYYTFKHTVPIKQIIICCKSDEDKNWKAQLIEDNYYRATQKYQ